jgi:hypothetical protein
MSTALDANLQLILDPDPQVNEDLLRLRDYLQRQDIQGARAWVQELAARWPDSERVQYYARVLAPPVARAAPGRIGEHRDQEMAWLKAHGRDYPGCWLAIFEDRLVAAHPDLQVVLAAAREALGDERAILFYQCPDRDTP